MTLLLSKIGLSPHVKCVWLREEKSSVFLDLVVELFVNILLLIFCLFKLALKFSNFFLVLFRLKLKILKLFLKLCVLQLLKLNLVLIGYYSFWVVFFQLCF